MRSLGRVTQEVSLSSSCHPLHPPPLTFISPTSSVIPQSVGFSSALIRPRQPRSFVVWASFATNRVNSDGFNWVIWIWVDSIQDTVDSRQKPYHVWSLSFFFKVFIRDLRIMWLKMKAESQFYHHANCTPEFSHTQTVEVQYLRLLLYVVSDMVLYKQTKGH